MYNIQTSSRYSGGEPEPPWEPQVRIQEDDQWIWKTKTKVPFLFENALYIFCAILSQLCSRIKRAKQ